MAQEQIARIRIPNHAFQDSQEQIDSHSIVARDAGSGSDNQRGPLIVVLIALASLVAILVLGSSIMLIRYRRIIDGTHTTRTTKCLDPRPKANKSHWLGRLGTKKAHQGDPQYIIHRGEGGIIHCQTPPPADLKSILLEPTLPCDGSKELPQGLRSQLSPTPPRCRIPSMAFDPSECSIDTIPRDPDNYMVHGSLDDSTFPRVSLDRASSADAHPLSEESIQGWMLIRPSIDSTTYPEAPTEIGEAASQRTVHNPKTMEKHGGLFKQLLATKMANQTSSPSTPPKISPRMSSTPSLLHMIRSVSSTLSFSPKTAGHTESMVLDISTSNKSQTDVLFGAWRPPSIIISPPTNTTLAPRDSMTCDVLTPNGVSANRPLEKEKAGQYMWQTSTPPRRPSRSTRKTSVQRRIST